MLESQLQRMDERRKENMNDAVNSTNFLDKLYEISMNKPDTWADMKGQE